MHTYSRFVHIAMVIVAIIISIPSLSGQTNFKLDKKNGHYYLTTTVNGVPDTEIFVETGFNALTLNKENFNKLFGSGDLEPICVKENEKLRFDRASYDILEVYKGEAAVGGLTYRGVILVIDTYDKIAVPFHKLINSTDSTANIMRFDFKKKTLDFVERGNVDVSKLHYFNIVRYEPYPTFEATLELYDTYGHKGDIHGNWVFDLGNGSSIFFFRKSIAPFIKANKFKVLSGEDKAGNAIGQGIFAQYCRLGDQKLTGIPIGITNRIWFDFALGCVGPSFFTKGYVLLDPAQNRIYYK